MNTEGRYLQWNVAIVGDKNASSKWGVRQYTVGKIERSKKTKPTYIDIGALRSGPDAFVMFNWVHLMLSRKTHIEKPQKNASI